MGKVQLLLPLMFTLSFYCLRVEGEGRLKIGKVHQRCRIEERDALFNFKQSLFHSQLILTNWDISEDCCTWEGVSCSNTTNNVVKLDLGPSLYFDVPHLYATSLDPSLFRLQHLQYLCLTGIDFIQTRIPDSIGSFTKLRYLDISYSGLIGVIPPHLGNLTNLQHLDLNTNNLVIDTSLDPWLFRLKRLQYLCLAGVQFKQTNILQKIDSFVSLRHLDLHSTGLQGVIPPHLGNLTNLYYLDLSSNSLFAFNLLSISRLSSIKVLRMSNVNLTFAINWLHEISVLPALSALYLSWCNLHTLPTYLPYFNFSSTLNTIDLSFNHLNGSLPNWLGQFTSLKSLSFDSNNLTGLISLASLSLLCNLNTLILRNNHFIKLIDDKNASQCIEYKIVNMDISMNQLSGRIPEWVGKMSNLINLDLGNNQLNGSFPQSLGQLTSLVYLDLCSNRLHGSLSYVNFANLSQLKLLYLSNNHLNFNMISFNWTLPFQISHLNLSSCPIGPQFPQWLQNQKSLVILDLSNCGISDNIPSWFWNISSKITYLNLSQNAIRGNLPMSLNIPAQATIDLKSNQLEGRIPRLTNFSFVSLSNNKFSSGIELFLTANLSFLLWLEISQNNLSGEIPKSICQMPSIILLDLSHNNLFGEIPKCHGNISSYKTLKFIKFTNNNLWGSIPQWIGNLPMLLSLYLDNNAFQGEIPFLKNCRKLITLNLGRNYLIGNIPLWIGDTLMFLKILSLRSNKFHGAIPPELSKLKGLQILDLADNFLSGSIPKSFQFLNSMSMKNRMLEPLIPNDSDIIITGVHVDLFDFSFDFESFTAFSDSLIMDIKGVIREFKGILSLVNIIDLSCNNLIGEIPIGLMSLVGLISLNLSRNQFTGHIPVNIGVMQSLESLDLSENNFLGEIPQSIVKLSGLNYLNLSYNQLSGSIPVGTQLDTFHESSYYGNPRLCGKPLLKACDGDQHNIHNGESNSDDDDFDLFLGMGLGFAVGLWSVLGTLLLKRSWAIAYFQFFHKMIDNIYVLVMVRVNQWCNR